FVQIENYRSGGFHPVSIGDSFASGRYRILHKLGFGGFSTVWLARDEHSHRLVSLKIIIEEASKTSNELKILQYLKESAIRHPACGHILSVLDHFTIEGPNCSHTCLVSPFDGPDLAQISHNPSQPAGSRRLRGSLARKLASPLILHLDLTPSNVLIQLTHVDSWSDQDVYELLGFPVQDQVRAWSGEAPPTNGGGIPMSYCAREVYFKGKASVWSDIWALGCTIFEIRAGEQLFASFLGGPHEVIRHIVQTLGKLPEPWWSSWKLRDAFFDEHGKPRKSWPNDIPMAVEYPLIAHIRDIGSEDNEVIADEAAHIRDIGSEGNGAIADEAALGDLKNIVRSEPDGNPIFEPLGMRLTEAEVEAFDDLLHKVLRYHPEQRLPVKEILKHAWFTISSEDSSAVNG
ncbi:protein kinase, partial [Lipomyces tetrasporus]